MEFLASSLKPEDSDVWIEPMVALSHSWMSCSSSSWLSRLLLCLSPAADATDSADFLLTPAAAGMLGTLERLVDLNVTFRDVVVLLPLWVRLFLPAPRRLLLLFVVVEEYCCWCVLKEVWGVALALGGIAIACMRGARIDSEKASLSCVSVSSLLKSWIAFWYWAMMGNELSGVLWSVSEADELRRCCSCSIKLGQSSEFMCWASSRSICSESRSVVILQISSDICLTRAFSRSISSLSALAAAVEEPFIMLLIIISDGL